jgi:hypothetical protein
MDKVVVRKIGTKKRKPGTRAGIKKTIARDAAGQSMQIFTIDARSPTFGDDLTSVYQANVATACLRKRKLFGSEDGPKDGKRLTLAGARHGRRKK